MQCRALSAHCVIQPWCSQGALLARAVATPLVSVASRHALRWPAWHYAGRVLLPRLQAEGLLDAVLAPLERLSCKQAAPRPLSH